jgi:hypothetical protein
MKSISGYLRKLKRDIFLPGATNKRWFELNFDKKTFSIKEKDDSPNYKEIIKFEEIKNYIPIPSKLFFKVCDYKYGFKIKTTNRKYILFAKTDEDIIKWEEGFKFILKNKNGEKDSFEIEDNINNNNINVCKNRNKEKNIYTIIRVCQTNNESHFSSRKTSENSNKENLKKNHFDFQKIHPEDENFIERRNSIVTYFAGNDIKIDKKRKKIISFFS